MHTHVVRLVFLQNIKVCPYQMLADNFQVIWFKFHHTYVICFLCWFLFYLCVCVCVWGGGVPSFFCCVCVCVSRVIIIIIIIIIIIKQFKC